MKLVKHVTPGTVSHSYPTSKGHENDSIRHLHSLACSLELVNDEEIVYSDMTSGVHVICVEVLNVLSCMPVMSGQTCLYCKVVGLHLKCQLVSFLSCFVYRYVCPLASLTKTCHTSLCWCLLPRIFSHCIVTKLSMPFSCSQFMVAEGNSSRRIDLLKYSSLHALCMCCFVAVLFVTCIV